jgi:hypothetical protein
MTHLVDYSKGGSHLNPLTPHYFKFYFFMRKQHFSTDSDENSETTFVNKSESESHLAVIIAVVSFVILLVCFSK